MGNIAMKYDQPMPGVEHNRVMDSFVKLSIDFSSSSSTRLRAEEHISFVLIITILLLLYFSVLLLPSLVVQQKENILNLTSCIKVKTIQVNFHSFFMNRRIDYYTIQKQIGVERRSLYTGNLHFIAQTTMTGRTESFESKEF